MGNSLGECYLDFRFGLKRVGILNQPWAGSHATVFPQSSWLRITQLSRYRIFHPLYIGGWLTDHRHEIFRSWDGVGFILIEHVGSRICKQGIWSMYAPSRLFWVFSCRAAEEGACSAFPRTGGFENKENSRVPMFRRGVATLHSLQKRKILSWGKTEPKMESYKIGIHAPSAQIWLFRCPCWVSCSSWCILCKCNWSTINGFI